MDGTMNPIDQQRWQAVVSRDAGDLAPFVYAVMTTGIYCRPGCAARTPRRENIRFFDDALAAGRAGYRPCKRCRPDAADQGYAAAIRHAVERIETAETEPALDTLAAEAGLSPSHFQRVFKQLVGVSPKQFAKASRARRLRDSLSRGATVTGAIYDAGYSGPGRAHEAALGMAPSRWRAGGAGEDIRYALADCSLGKVMVAGTARGICAIELGDDGETLVDALKTRFPKASLVPADASFDDWLRAVIAVIDDPAKGIDLPLDIRGTAFQHRVWQALRKIPPGTTMSYAELAAAIGRPGAARAVARACASNQIAVAVPCHRVIRADGGRAGYRWGIKRKNALLGREAESENRR